LRLTVTFKRRAAGWGEPTCCALTLCPRWSEADHTNTSLASVCVFDATSTREIHSRPQNQIATPLSIAKYRWSALAHTNSLLCYCSFLIVRRPRPSTTTKTVPTRCGRKTVFSLVTFGFIARPEFLVSYCHRLAGQRESSRPRQSIE
jgi:hypothetical protein